MYALRVLRAHGLPATSLEDVFRATVMAKLLYCSPAWGRPLLGDGHRSSHDAFVRRCKRHGYCNCCQETLTVAELLPQEDDDFFNRINTNSQHILFHYLPTKNTQNYNTRPRNHKFSLIEQSVDLNHRDFFVRMLYKYAY